MATCKNGRKMISVTMTADLYEELVRHCKSIDVPVSVWCRDLIKRKLRS